LSNAHTDLRSSLQNRRRFTGALPSFVLFCAVVFVAECHERHRSLRTPTSAIHGEEPPDAQGWNSTRHHTSARSISEKLLAIGAMSSAAPNWRSICAREITPRTRSGVCALADSTTSR
jgi:hypothetical protein